MNVAKNSFMKKIDCTMSEKNMKKRSKAENRKICIDMKKRNLLLPRQMLMSILRTLVITFRPNFSCQYERIDIVLDLFEIQQ